MKQPNPAISSLGEAAILVQFDPIISEDLLEMLLRIKQVIRSQRVEVKLEVITAYNSLLVLYPFTIEDFYREKKWLLTVIEGAKVHKRRKPRQLLLPVCYDPLVAPDLDLVSKQKKLSRSQVIAIHCAGEYRVFMIGFLPGFPYLGGLDKRLEIPRKEQPRRKVAAGSVGIAGSQTGIYPQESPGGWQIIGRCPIPLFDPLADPPCPIAPGDVIKFREIGLAEFDHIQKQPQQILLQ